MNSATGQRNKAVVTGMGVVCSIGADVESFTAALRHGVSGIEMNPWGEEGPPFGAVIQGFTLATALARRQTLPEQMVQSAQRAARRSPFAIQVATAAVLEAWERARLHEVPVAPKRLGLIVAGSNLTSRHAESLRPCFDRNALCLAGRFALQFQDTDHLGTLSEILGIKGEGYTIGGASASGNVGIINGSRLVEQGVVDVCLVAGALCDLSAMEMQAFLNIGAMACRSPSDAPQSAGPPFDRLRRGFVLGQASASLVLESSTSAARRGVQVLAEVGAYAMNLDANQLADPSEEGEATAMASTLQRAGLAPHQVPYVNTHGSGSILGDDIELRALHRVFGSSLGATRLNATKSLTGHCLAAAGVLEAIATVIQMEEHFLHANVALEQPIDAECRFVGPQAEPATIPFALSNSFGFGGINTSVLLAHPEDAKVTQA